jgi:hypothetical protein
MCPPFNMIATIFLPFFLLIKNEKVLIKLNNALLFAGYFPFMVILTLGFITVNAVLLPFAYVCALVDKIANNVNFLSKRGHKLRRIRNPIVFFFFGLLFLVINMIMDAIKFVRHLFQKSNK